MLIVGSGTKTNLFLSNLNIPILHLECLKFLLSHVCVWCTHTYWRSGDNSVELVLSFFTLHRFQKQHSDCQVCAASGFSCRAI